MLKTNKGWTNNLKNEIIETGMINFGSNLFKRVNPKANNAVGGAAGDKIVKKS